jgi:hypothetical protein
MLDFDGTADVINNYRYRLVSLMMRGAFQGKISQSVSPSQYNQQEIRKQMSGICCLQL